MANPTSTIRIARAKALQAKVTASKVTAYCAIENLLPIYSESYAFDPQAIERFEAAIQTLAKKHVEAIGKCSPSHRRQDSGLAINKVTSK